MSAGAEDGRGAQSNSSESVRPDPARPAPTRRARDAPRGRPPAQLTPRPAETPAGRSRASAAAGQATMAGKAAASGTAVLLVTANVGSLFDDVSAAARPTRPRALDPGPWDPAPAEPRDPRPWP